MLGRVVSILGLLLLPSQLPHLSPLEREGQDAWSVQAFLAVSLHPSRSPSRRDWVGESRVGAVVPGEDVVDLLAVLGPGLLEHMVCLSNHPRV